ncbi:pyrroline-5-carboxylate reductase [Desulfoscipio geothermicus]|uniref:Pyrroline-5-carboxylate reductase n=1 Tax=Desulfoscipio geothermicus DSM 3669 TaxID=1121426 RepID=A0A1I6E9L5_9FIRM|nr:pyrroline-5-carboxylate reductase [Desulfoscipio geothermicus]SFR14424.1 pyrroline-5-carboxylate reductase [Desulfoscipio geothermicus DSM 3669]
MPVGEYNFGFIGGGAIAEALVAGVTGAGLVAPEKIRVSDVNAERREYLREKLGVAVTPDNTALVAGADIVVLAVKPFVIGEVLGEIGGQLSEKQIVISVAAGVPTAYIEKFFSVNVPVVRAMPNTPALVGAAATAVCRGRWATGEHLELARAVFGVVGRAIPVREDLMDAVTGLSGSGPAYMYVIAEALADAGVRVGLPRDVSLTLAAQTMLGAARMILETERHPGVLKDMVTTPGGTTIEGLFALEEGGLRAVLGRAVENACRRSRQLSGDNN